MPCVRCRSCPVRPPNCMAALSRIVGHALQDLNSRPAFAGGKMSCVKRQRCWSRDGYCLLLEKPAAAMIYSAKGMACMFKRCGSCYGRSCGGTDDIFRRSRCGIVNGRRRCTPERPHRVEDCDRAFLGRCITDFENCCRACKMLAGACSAE
jgi:hypothetical protein